MKQKIRLLTFLVITFFAASGLLHAASFTVEESTGTVQVLKAGQTTWAPLNKGMNVEPGDAIKTEASSNAKLKMEKGDIRLEEKTGFAVKEFTAKDEEIKASLELTIGQLKAKIGKMKKGSLVEFRTPTSVASVRGTGLGLLVYTFENQLFTRLDVFEGTVGFSDLNGQHGQNVGAGKHSTGSEDGTTPPVDNDTGNGDTSNSGAGNDSDTISQGLESTPGFQQDTAGSQDNASGNPNEAPETVQVPNDPVGDDDPAY
jgi:hypothetical protein